MDPVAILAIAVLILMFGWLLGPPIWQAVESRLWQWHIPAPAAGQVWRSERNGDRIKVTEVRMHASGTIFWSWTRETEHPCPLAMEECGLRNWRLMVRDERRVLV